MRQLNRFCSIVVGLYFAGIFLYLLRNAVMPITAQSAWRGPADVIAVTFYLLGIVPLLGLTLVDLNIIGRERTLHGKMAIHELVALRQQKRLPALPCRATPPVR